jgi:hypothetical protein
MFDTPIDAWYVWLGLSVASLAVFGVVTALPTAPTPDATDVVETIDRVAATSYDTTATRDLDAHAIRIETRRVGLRNDAGAAHATLAAPVVPVNRETRLVHVLRGAPPRTVFHSPAALRDRVAVARDHEPRWRPAEEALVVRHVIWGEVDVTLVGTAPDPLDGAGTVGRTNATSERTKPSAADPAIVESGAEE